MEPTYEILEEPLSLEVIEEEADEDGYITAYVAVALDDDLIESDREGFLETLSQKITGTDAMCEITYRAVGILDPESCDPDIVMEVTGDVSELIY